MEQASKQRKEIAQEDMLLQVLVPDIEQPFAIPENWKWCYLQFLSQIKTGKKDANYGSENGRYLFFTCAAEPIRCDYYSFEGKAILLAGNGDIGNISLYDGKFEAYQRTYVLTITEEISTEYLYFYFKYRWVDYNTDKIFGTAIPYIRLGNLQNFPVPLAPAAEQQRIVDRIESFFAKLDEAKEKAQAVVDGFEDRKAAILHKAFTGELTKKHSNHSNKWKNVFLRDIVSGFKYGTSEKSDYSYTGMPVLRIPNIGEDGIVFSDIKYLTTEYIDGESQIHENDILIIRSNGSRDLVGKCALVPSLDQEYAYASFLIRIKPSEKIRADYLALYLNSREARNQMSIKAKSSAGIHNINSKELGSIIVRLPSLNEQKEIVIAIQKLMQPEKQANELALETIDQINSMKKAILARAFRGELGTNDPNDESAIELLKRIL